MDSPGYRHAHRHCLHEHHLHLALPVLVSHPCLPPLFRRRQMANLQRLTLPPQPGLDPLLDQRYFQQNERCTWHIPARRHLFPPVDHLAGQPLLSSRGLRHRTPRGRRHGTPHQYRHLLSTGQRNHHLRTGARPRTRTPLDRRPRHTCQPPGNVVARRRTLLL